MAHEGSDGTGDVPRGKPGSDATGSDVAEMIVAVAAPLASVRAAWTSEGMAAWWWPMFGDTTYDFTPAVGRSWRIATAEGGFGARGEFLDVDEDLIVLTWWWETDEDQTEADTVTVSFALGVGETQVRVAHRARPAALADLREGWLDCLERLAAQY
ncbi:MAG TPA: hypothetical protein DHV14_04760 [Micrococcales bacterium]|uniref:SRPBCC family protein n=1 Tax=Miniimonas arenae TaxID=676201 RepID=UPI000EBA073D|nr:SRPBCC domain-containing protein [Miniimonas arenae]HCX84443.1 hypothetical protein [Micrococcales bacterium]